MIPQKGTAAWPLRLVFSRPPIAKEPAMTHSDVITGDDLDLAAAIDEIMASLPKPEPWSPVERVPVAWRRHALVLFTIGRGAGAVPQWRAVTPPFHFPVKEGLPVLDEDPHAPVTEALLEATSRLVRGVVHYGEMMALCRYMTDRGYRHYLYKGPQ